jgi:deazaflavin-dependent oxidoreductase (nitroreductase family)
MTSPWDRIDEARDSRDPSVVEHVHRYLATDGASGYLEGGVPNLLLTVVGRRSGILHRTALFFGEDDGRYVLVASGGGITHTHPAWYRNVIAHPEVHVQIRGERFRARAYTAEGAERERLWRLMTEIAPVYRTHYEPLTRRVIPVVVLERLDDA